MGISKEAPVSLKYSIRVSADAEADIRAIKDVRIRELIRQRIEKLTVEPAEQGKQLRGNLAEFRAVRAVGQRFRIIYEVIDDLVVVLIVGVGMRKQGDKKDVYSKLKKRNRP